MMLYAVTTHATSARDALEYVLAISANATLTMDRSSVVMKAPADAMAKMGQGERRSVVVTGSPYGRCFINSTHCYRFVIVSIVSGVSARTRTYGQYCPIAQALDVVGDRWTLLILRELSGGARRFTDLRESLPGIAPNLLVERLRDLEAEGLVARQELPPPAARSVYVLTAEGREVRPLLSALARFGATRLPPPQASTVVPPRAAFAAAVTSFHRPVESAGWDEHYRFVIDGRTFDVRSSHGRLRAGPEAGQPDVVVHVSAHQLMHLRQGRVPLHQAIADGSFEATGSPVALDHLRTTFDLDFD